jgi:hypothetical protein
MFPSLARALPLLAAVVLTACGGSGVNNAVGTAGSSSGSSSSSSSSSSGSSSSSSSSSGVANVGNVVDVTVGPGPTPASSFFNIPVTTIKVCLPGSTTSCQTIANVLVDTGSFGLRILASALNGLIATANYQHDTAGNFIVECLPFADGYTWGPVASVDLYIGGEKALSLPINIVDDSTNHDQLQPAAPQSCQSFGNGPDIGGVDHLGANAVLGVGLFSYDCGDYCTVDPSLQAQGSFYYSCSVGVCTPTSEPLVSQVINPVAMFPVDNNGVVLKMDAIGAGGAATASGKLTFGIGTQTNNVLGSATKLTTDSQGFIVTMFNSQTLSNSFLDSGSNGLYFPDVGVPTCPTNAGGSEFYCPTTSPLPLTAANQGQNGATSQVSLQIVTLDAPGVDTQFAIDVGGPTTPINGSTAYFDFGAPFFYGRTVFTGMLTAPLTGTQTTSQDPFVAY